jgi:hypothetical protein
MTHRRCGARDAILLPVLRANPEEAYPFERGKAVLFLFDVGHLSIAALAPA